MTPTPPSPSASARAPQHASSPAPENAQTPALEIQGLRFRYVQRDPALAPDQTPWSLEVPALTIAPGEQFLLTGTSGRGKSTLLHLIAGLMDPDAGVVRVAGHDIHALAGPARDRFRGRHVGMIFQTFQLLPGFSALENVTLALLFSDIPPREHDDRARGLLAELGIDRPHAPATALSVGQQQRVAVARALACGPALVLADEPTASLDPDRADTAMDIIQTACRAHGASLLCVSHDPAMASRFPRRASLDELASPKLKPKPAT